MFMFHCPHCQEVRDEEEFSYAGEAFIARPSAPDTTTDVEWGDYIFMRKNPKGWHWEQWVHAAACRKVMVVKRHTTTHEVAGSWALAEGKRIYLEEQK
jgi:sarcosine oxidase subunit delta